MNNLSCDPFDSKKIMVLGDIMLDHYIWGSVERISPEAPVPVLEVKREEYRLGGAANVALNIKSLGAEVVLIGVCGDDDNGAQLKETLNSHGIGHRRIGGGKRQAQHAQDAHLQPQSADREGGL